LFLSVNRILIKILIQNKTKLQNEQFAVGKTQPHSVQGFFEYII